MVDLLSLLYDILTDYIASLEDVNPERYLFATPIGDRHTATNIRRRVVAPVVRRANKRLLAPCREPLRAKLTPHSMLRTYASLPYALGHTPLYVMEQLS